MGGIEAVVWTDVIQGLLLISGGLLCVGVVLWGSDAAPNEIIRHAWDEGKFNVDRWDFEWTGNNQWLYLLGGILMWLQSYGCGQN